MGRYSGYAGWGGMCTSRSFKTYHIAIKTSITNHFKHLGKGWLIFWEVPSVSFSWRWDKGRLKNNNNKKKLRLQISPNNGILIAVINMRKLKTNIFTTNVLLKREDKCSHLGMPTGSKG